MNCRWNEEKVFPSTPVQDVLEQHFVEARLHTDGDRGEELTEYQESVAHSIATPLYLVMEPDTRRVVAGPVGGIVAPEAFREFLLGAWQDSGPEERVGRLERD